MGDMAVQGTGTGDTVVVDETVPPADPADGTGDAGEVTPPAEGADGEAPGTGDAGDTGGTDADLLAALAAQIEDGSTPPPDPTVTDSSYSDGTSDADPVDRQSLYDKLATMDPNSEEYQNALKKLEQMVQPEVMVAETLVEEYEETRQAAKKEEANEEVEAKKRLLDRAIDKKYTELTDKAGLLEKAAARARNTGVRAQLTSRATLLRQSAEKLNVCRQERTQEEAKKFNELINKPRYSEVEMKALQKKYGEGFKIRDNGLIEKNGKLINPSKTLKKLETKAQRTTDKFVDELEDGAKKDLKLGEKEKTVGKKLEASAEEVKRAQEQVAVRVAPAEAERRLNTALAKDKRLQEKLKRIQGARTKLKDLGSKALDEGARLLVRQELQRERANTEHGWAMFMKGKSAQEVGLAFYGVGEDDSSKAVGTGATAGERVAEFLPTSEHETRSRLRALAERRDIEPMADDLAPENAHGYIGRQGDALFAGNLQSRNLSNTPFTS